MSSIHFQVLLKSVFSFQPRKDQFGYAQIKKAFQTTGTPSNSKAGKDGWKSAVVLRQIRPLDYPICRPCGLHTCARCRFEDDNRRFPLPTCRAAYSYPNATYGSADHPQFNCTLVTRHGQSGILRQLALLRPAPFP